MKENSQLEIIEQNSNSLSHTQLEQSKASKVKKKAKLLQGELRDIDIECSKQFKWNLYFYVSGQSGPIWAVLKLLENSNKKLK